MSDDLERRFEQVSELPTPERDLAQVRSRRLRLRARKALLSTAVIVTVAAVAVAAADLAPFRRDAPPPPAAADDESNSEEPVVRVETETIELGDQPMAVATGAGSVWVTTGMHRELLEMRDGDIINRFEGGGVGVAVSDGVVWQTRGGDGAEPDGDVTGIDASTGEVVQHLEFPGESPYGITVRGRDVFIALAHGDLVRPDPEKNAEMRIALATGLTDVMAAHGAVWVSQPGGQNPKVWRVTVEGDDRNAAPILLTPQGRGSCPQGLAATAEAVWVADPCAGALWQLDPSGRIIDRIAGVGRKPVDVAAGRGFLFVSSFRGDELVTVIDRRAKEVVARVEAGPWPSSIAADGDEAWVANSEGTSLTRVIIHTDDPAHSMDES